MKKLMYVLAIVFLASNVVSAHENHRAGKSILNIDLNIYGNITVEIDGIPYTCHNGNIDVRGLVPGRHHIVVLENRVTNRGYARRVVINEQRFFVPANSRVKAVVRRNGVFDILRIGRRANNQTSIHNNRGYNKGQHYNRGNNGKGHNQNARPKGKR
tara:strand:+ start:205865 stop:206335 length:471 start_codon:yes stop_codon:yes gene_type:complete